jgi:hypothetical protein
MPRPKDMGPADLAPNTAPPETRTPEEARKAQRNMFYNSLPTGAKDTFIETLKDAAERGLDEQTAWEEAVLAVESMGAAPEPEDNL